MGAAGRSQIGRFCLAGFSLALSLVALGLAGSEKASPRTPRQTSGEEEAGSRAPGVWGSWGPWSACSQPCGLGVLERARSCQSPYQRDPWAGGTDGVPRPPVAQQQQQQQRSGFGDRLSGHWPAYPPRSDRNSGSALSVRRGNPHGPTNRHVRQEAGAAVDGALPHSQTPRDPHAFPEAARSWGSPRGRERFPSRPQRPPAAGDSRTPAQKVIPLYKPVGQGGSNQEEDPPGSWPDGWAASPVPDSQAAWRSRVRETIKPGKYGYGRVPFALPLHKDPAEEGAPRFKRHHGEKAGEPPPSPAPSALLPAAGMEPPSPAPPSAGKPGSLDRIRPGAERMASRAGASFPEDRGAAVGLTSGRAGEGDSAGPSSTPRQGPLPIPGEGDPHSSAPGPPEDPASRAGGPGVAEEGASAPAGVSSSQRPPPPSSPPPQGDPRWASPQVPESPISAPQGKRPGRGPDPRASVGRVPRQPPRPAPRPHLRPGRARSRNQRRHQPQGGGGGPRPSHHLFLDQPGLRRPSEPEIWQLHRGSPVPLHAGGQGPRAEPPQWNLYAPGTETFHCQGESRQHRACRLETCPPDRPDPRAVQCAAYNSQEFMGRFYQWEPFTDVWGSQRCELNCRPLGYRFYVRHTEKVQDGTPCEASSQDICVGGQCLTPGCDGILASNRTLDECGVCGGEGSACQMVRGNYSETNVPIGYHRILQIPAGAARIQVREMARSPNYLALRTQSGQSIINGNWAVNAPGRYEAAGTVFVYSDQEGGELLTAEGPTTTPVELYMIFQQDNPGVSYQFLLAQPGGSPPHARRPQEEFAGTSTVVEPPAGGAPQLPSAPRRTPVSAQLPSPSSSWGGPRDGPPPPASASQSRRSLETLQRSARVPPLPPPPPPARHSSEAGQDFYWRRFGNTECSASCGKGFWQSVHLCVSRGSQEEVGEEKCLLLPKPPVEEEVCNTEPCPAFWDAGEWSACSLSCGRGMQHRQVLCRQVYANRTTMVHPQRCGHLEKPNATRPCQVHLCSHWETQTNWSSCSVLCGTGHRSRHVRCVSNHGELLRDTDCPDNQRPQTSEPCNMGPCVRSWFYSDWSNTCSADCGPGIHRRSVVCLSSNTDGQADEDCASPKPADMRACDGGPCQRAARWYQGPWSSCSEECGHGTRRRDIICVSKQGTQFNVTPAAECAHLEKPASLQPCVGTDCEARWFSTAWSTCSRPCMGGVQAREVQCLTQNRTLSTLCPLHLKPATRRPCNTQPCLPSLDVTCQDRYANCAVIVQARLCVYSYYKAACCASCSHILERRHAQPSR